MNEYKSKHYSWYALSREEALQRLDTTMSGLESREAKKRQAQFGPNDLPRGSRASWLTRLIAQFRSTFVLVLLGASLVSFILNDVLDGWVILAAVFVNAVVGYVQEGKAKKSLEALRATIQYSAKVIRDGKRLLVSAPELVPGDLVELVRGDRVPADMRLVHSEHLQVDESMLTGESKDVQKRAKVLEGKLILPDQLNMAFLGTLVTSGYAVGLVVETGVRTAVGQLSQMLSVPDEQTILQKRMDRLAKQLGGVIFLACGLLFLIGIFSGEATAEMFTTSVAVAVSAIPEGMAAVVTIVLAFGMKQILARRGLVRSLPAAETLGSATVICTDKTGTITTGEMKLRTLSTRHHEVKDATKSWYESLEKKPHELIKLFEFLTLCNDAEEEESQEGVTIQGNFTDQALLRFTRGLGFSQRQLLATHPRISSIPFDSENKFMATLHHSRDSNLLIYKGSPELVLQSSLSVLDDEIAVRISSDARERLKHQYSGMTKNGLRVLGVAYKELPKYVETLEQYPLTDMTIVGFIGLSDPVRADVPEMISLLKKSHVKVLMVTGDNQHTAISVAREVGLETDGLNAVTGEEIDRMNETELMESLKSSSVCARIVPEHKLRIIQALKASGHVVAMTGDGVNDAPALKSADIGIALGSGTDVAKEASDMILLDNSFSTIGNALFLGRLIFSNIRKIIVYLLSDSFTELLLIASAFALGLPAIPLLASQILWKNLIADGLPALALSQSIESQEVLNTPPRPRGSPLLERQHKVLIGVMSVLFALVGLLLFILFLKSGNASIEYARSAVFAFVSLAPLLNIVNLRKESPATSDIRGIIENRYMLWSLLVSIGLLVVAFSSQFLRSVLHLIPLSVLTWLQVLILSVLCVMIVGFVKERMLHRFAKTRARTRSAEA